MKRLAQASLVILLLTMASPILSAEATDRPAGVAAKDWVPVSDRLGIVIVHSETPDAVAPPRQQPLLLRPPVAGYFMVRGAGGWARLILVDPAKGPADAG